MGVPGATRDHILSSAEKLVLRNGVSGLTMDGIAKEAGISKGGLLYHFSTKEKLIQGLVARLIQHFEEDLTAYSGQVSKGPGQYTRAFVKATLQGTWDTRTGLRPHGLEVFVTLIASLATDPHLLEPLRQRYLDWQLRLENDGIDPARATVARLAVDGLWLSELLGFVPLSPKLRREVLDEILSLAEPQPGACREGGAR